MNLTDYEKIVDEEKFLESHRARILHPQKDRLTHFFKRRLLQYADMKKVKMCTTCWTIIQDNEVKCPNCRGVNNPK